MSLQQGILNPALLSLLARVRQCIGLIRTGCDTSYIEGWTKALELLNLWQECKP